MERQNRTEHTTPKLMSEQEALEFLAANFDEGYRSTKYLTRHPKNITIEEFLAMPDDDFPAFTEAMGIIEDIRSSLPRRPEE